MSASKNIYGLFAAVMLFGALVGCGGNGSNPSSDTTPGLAVAGGVASSAGTSDAEIPASSAPSTIMVGGESVLIPATSTSYPAGTKVAVLSSSAPILSGVVGGGALTRALGDVIVRELPEGNSTVLTGIVSSDFQLTQDVALLPGSYEITIDGPWNIVDGSKTLTTQTFIFDATVTTNGEVSLPGSFTGSLPTNGSSTQQTGVSASGLVNGVFAGADATLSLSSGTSSISKTVATVENGLGSASFTFEDLVGGFFIPSSGLDSVHFSLTVE